MTFTEKLGAATILLRSKGLRRPLYAPTIVALLWRFGVEIPPPHFAGFAGTFAFAGAAFGGVWGLVMWFAMWSASGVPAFEALRLVALVGFATGGFVAIYYRVSARRHRVPRWADFHPTGSAAMAS